MRSRSAPYWYVTQQIERQIYTRERQLRDERVLNYIIKCPGPVSVKEVRLELGLSFKQAIESLARNEYFGVVLHRQTSKWNGQHWIYPHEFWAT